MVKYIENSFDEDYIQTLGAPSRLSDPGLFRFKFPPLVARQELFSAFYYPMLPLDNYTAVVRCSWRSFEDVLC